MEQKPSPSPVSASPLNIGEATLEPNTSLPSSTYPLMQSATLHREKDRLKTFETWPVEFLSPRVMTAAGFYYLRRDDVVRCAFCGIEVGKWELGDDPMADHKKWAPDCRFVNKVDNCNVPISDEVEQNFSQTANGYDTCGPNGMNIVSLDESNSESVLEKHIRYQKARDPSFPQYSSYSSRLKTYDSWPISLKLWPDILSDAGFFYTGKSDQTVCYNCGGGLKDWEDSDQPWVEHARWFSKCPFVLLVKGKEFIDEACGRTKPTSETNTGALTQSTSTGDLERESSSRQNVVVNEEKSDEQLSRNVISKREPSGESSDGRLCKICFTEEMGVVFLPCGHIVACVKCALSMRTCAVCRKPVSATFRAFLS